jgi:hypothetical protein
VTVRRAAWLALVALSSLPGIVAAQRPAPGAAIDLDGFRYERDIPRGDGLTVVLLDAAALAHSRLDDIRIVDAQRRQIQYVTEPGPTLALSLPPLKLMPSSGTRGGLTRYRAQLPFAGLPDAVLHLQTSERVFQRAVTIDAFHATWSHDDPSTPAPTLDAVLPNRLAADSLVIAVNDGDNQKLSIVGATLRVPTFRLRFYRDSSSALRMFYGRADLSAPHYDMALVADRLRDSTAADVELGPEHVLRDTTNQTPKTVFWVVLAGAVVILLLLIARLLRRDDDDRPPVSRAASPPADRPATPAAPAPDSPSAPPPR